ncbi:MAG: glycosyltransferase family 2 protein, partial [Candidatus Thioglobus sp.]
MIKEPLISVVMPAYNAGAFLVESIESITNQSYKNFELIIINDGSTDDSGAIIAKYAEQDKRICVLSQKNKGIAVALNNGIKRSKGQYIARMDADDISLKERLMVQVEFLEKNPQIDVLGCNCSTIDNASNTTGRLINANTIKEIAATLCVHTPFTHSSLMLRKSLFEQYSYEDTPCEDYWLLAQCFNRGNFANINQVLLKYRHNYGHSLSDSKRMDMYAYNETVGRYFFNKHQTYLKQIINSQPDSKRFIHILSVMFI